MWSASKWERVFNNLVRLVFCFFVVKSFWILSLLNDTDGCLRVCASRLGGRASWFSRLVDEFVYNLPVGSECVDLASRGLLVTRSRVSCG